MVVIIIAVLFYFSVALGASAEIGIGTIVGAIVGGVTVVAIVVIVAVITIIVVLIKGKRTRQE